MDLQKIYLQKKKFATRNVGNEMVLVAIKNNIAEMNELLTLNELGRFIWNNINESNSEQEIVKAVINEFDVDEDTAIKDVHEFLVQLELAMWK